jgi:hypothetical protein
MEEMEVVCTVQCDLVRYGTVRCGVVWCGAVQCDETERSVYPDPPDTLRRLPSLAQMQAELLDRPRDLLGE